MTLFSFIPWLSPVPPLPGLTLHQLHQPMPAAGRAAGPSRNPSWSASTIEQHLEPLAPELLARRDQAEQLACRRRLWDLRLRLRLEERWLGAAGALCPGHRGGHQDAARAALAQFCRSSGSRRARLAWLQELQGWFTAHRRGPDAMAYALARHRSEAASAVLP